VPVTLEHVVWPLLLSLARGPDAALALVGIGRTLGGTLTAKHLLPPLLAVLASSGTVRQSWSGGSSALRVSFLSTVEAPLQLDALPWLTSEVTAGVGAMTVIGATMLERLPALQGSSVRVLRRRCWAP